VARLREPEARLLDELVLVDRLCDGKTRVDLVPWSLRRIELEADPVRSWDLLEDDAISAFEL